MHPRDQKLFVIGLLSAVVVMTVVGLLTIGSSSTPPF
jgi:hypothetical protein